MLSPGRWHERVPRERGANLRFRSRLLSLARQSGANRQALYEACRQDLLFYVNAFVWQFNPRKKGQREVGPFVTWDFQDEAVRTILECVQTDQDLLIEKSREMGASWLCLLVMEWMWHFHDWQKFLMISRSEKAVEDEDADSLFWKLDFVHRHLPDWLMPGGRRENVIRRGMYFGNAFTNSSITGQASTGKAGVGGRATAMFIDEFSQVREGREVYDRTSDTTGCRIFNGTHKGTDTAFYELSKKETVRKLVLHWSQHPDKRPGAYRFDAAANRVEVVDRAYHYPPDFDFVRSEAPSGGPFPGLRSPWYDRECQRKGTSRAVAMDLDIDAAGTSSRFFEVVTLRALIASYACEPYWQGDVVYDHETGLPQGLVRLTDGPLKLWLHPKAGGKIPAGRYGMGADISTGAGATNSCLSVVNADTGEKVLEYATATAKPEQLAPAATAIAWMFQNNDGEPALFAWEHHGPGTAFGVRVLELGYRRIYYREAHQSLAGGRVSDVPGWFPSNENKRLLLDDYRGALEGRAFTNHSRAAIEECERYQFDAAGNVSHPQFVRNDDHTGARVNHGDRVIADALAWKMCKSLGTVGSRKVEAQVRVGTLAWRRQLAGGGRAEDEGL